MAREILSYFLHNPQAADSLEGVATWRLLDESVRRTVEEAREALAWLVARGYLKQEVRRSTVPIFALNQERARDAGAFLQAEAPPPAPAKGRPGPR